MAKKTITIYGVSTTDNAEGSRSFKAFCSTPEIAARELEKYKDWGVFYPPKPDNVHIKPIELITE